MNIPLSPCVPESLASRDRFSRPVSRQTAHLHTQAESGAYLRDFSRVPRRRPFMKPPYATGSVPSSSGHAIAYRWRSLPRGRRHRASKSQGSFETSAALAGHHGPINIRLSILYYKIVYTVLMYVYYLLLLYRCSLSIISKIFVAVARRSRLG